MPSFPRLPRVVNVFVPSQTFEGFVIIDGKKVRPYARPTANGRVKIGWEMEINSQWVEVSSREYA
jgi:hypothetical protein